MSKRSRDKKYARATRPLSQTRVRAAVPPPRQTITLSVTLWLDEAPAFAAAVDEFSNEIGSRTAVSATLAQELAMTRAASAFGKLRASVKDVARDANFLQAPKREDA
jgi:hypothetical protein